MNSFDECINSGVKFAEKGNFSDALSAFAKAKNYAYSKEQKAIAYWNSAIARASKGDAVDCIFDLGVVLENDPNHTNARKSLINFSNDTSLPSGVRELAIKKLSGN